MRHIGLYAGWLVSVLLVSIGPSGRASQGMPRLEFNDERTSAALQEKFLALTDGWALEAVLKRSEKEAMERGRRWESLMITGLDDPVALKILESGEPSYEALASYYPGKVLDRTVLGTYSDPQSNPNVNHNEFIIWWNGALSAHLVEGTVRGVRRPIAANTNLVFRVGPSAEMFGKQGEAFSRIGYEEGYLPIVRARYDSDGVRYEETAFAGDGNVAYISFKSTNVSTSPRMAEFFEEITLVDGSRARASGSQIINSAGAALLIHSDPDATFDEAGQRLRHRFELPPAATAAVYFKLPYLPDRAGTIRPIDKQAFESARGNTRRFWTELMSSGIKIQVPEARVNDIWRALVLQNFILADGPRFTYGSGLWYNSSYFPVENGMGTNDFAFLGFGDYSHLLLPMCMDVSLYKNRAGRKYQNRRGLALHHLYENYRLTRKLDVFERYRSDLIRAADEIIADRRTTMAEVGGKKPLHWGLLPPDRPGADDLGGNYKMYVLAHNITSCQGLQDFGNFLLQSSANESDRARGEHYLREARDYRRTILEAMKTSVIHSERRPPFVPLETLYFRETPDYGPDPYDDLARGRVQGIYYHYWADMELGYNFLNPDDQIARWITDYLEKMGGFVLGCTRARHRPEQEYGWINNVYNSGYYNFVLRRSEIERFLLGFYSRLAFGMSRHVYVASEGSPFIGYNTKNGGFVGADYSFPNSAANSETLRMLRSMLILEELHDNVETGDIYLTRGVPRHWFSHGQRIQVENAPTYFGEMAFAIESKVNDGIITARIRPPNRDRYRAIVVSFRHPKKSPIHEVRVNGERRHDFDVSKEQVRLPFGPKEFTVEVRYRP